MVCLAISSSLSILSFEKIGPLWASPGWPSMILIIRFCRIISLLSNDFEEFPQEGSNSYDKAILVSYTTSVDVYCLENT